LAGDIKATRLVIYGALLGVLDPVLTLAAAGQTDGTRMPTEAMMQSLSAAATPDGKGSDSDSDSTEAAAPGGAAAGPLAGGSRKRVQFEEARKMQRDRRVELAGGDVSDHAVTLAAFKVRLFS
jgi:hypothetical protein